MPQRTECIRVVNRDRSWGRGRLAASIGWQNYERQSMTLGCEVETNLRAESRFSPDDITLFGDSNDRAAIAQSAYQPFRHLHAAAWKGRQDAYQGRPTVRLRVFYRFVDHREGRKYQEGSRAAGLDVEIVSPIMPYDMTELWRDAVKSMCSMLDTGICLKPVCVTVGLLRSQVFLRYNTCCLFTM